MGGTQETLSEYSDQIDALEDADRRLLLFALWESSPGEDILDQLDEAGQRSSRPDFRTAMIHVHLPKLDDYEFIDWDRETDTVRRGPAFDELEPLLDALDARGDELLLEAGRR